MSDADELVWLVMNWCVGILPKRGVDTSCCELVRFYKMHAQNNVCEPVSMIAPRKVSNITNNGLIRFHDFCMYVCMYEFTSEVS